MNHKDLKLKTTDSIKAMEKIILSKESTDSAKIRAASVMANLVEEMILIIREENLDG